MADTPLTNNTLAQQTAYAEGRERRNRWLTHLLLHSILIFASFVALIPFYWMLATSGMTLGEVINRRWIPALQWQEDFGIVGVSTEGGLRESRPLGNLVEPLRNYDRNSNELAVFVTALELQHPGIMAELRAYYSTNPNITAQVDEWVSRTAAIDVASVPVREGRQADIRAQAARFIRDVYGIPVHINYLQAWDEAKFGKYFLNSVIITALTIVGLLATSIPAGYAFAKIRFFGRNFIFAVLLATLMIPESVTMIPNLLVVKGQVFNLPLLETNWLWFWWTGATPYFSFAWNADVSWIDHLEALTIPFMADAFAIFLLRQFFVKVPDELWEAAKIDGCSHLRFLWQVAVPIARPAIVTVALLTFISSWNAFLWPLLVTNDDTWLPLMVGLYSFTSEAGTDLHLLMAAAAITVLPMIVLYFFTQKTFTEGIATSGLKG